MALVNPDGIACVRACLGEASGLADQFSAGDYDFPDEVAKWLVELESAANDARLAVVPRVAGLRVALDAARRGIAEPREGQPRATRRHARNAAAQMAMRSAIDLVCEAIEPLEARRMRAENIALEVVARSFEKALWPGQSTAPGAPADMPSMWRALLVDNDLGPPVRELSVLLGMPQSLVLVARTMNEYAGNGA